MSHSGDLSALLSVRNIKKYFEVKRTKLIEEKKTVKAVDGVTFDIFTGVTLGLVGESGCGKSTLGRAILRLIEPTEGEVFFAGENILQLKPKELRERRRDFQIVFQDPYASLNPRLTIGQIIEEPYHIQKVLDRRQATLRMKELLEVVGLRSAFATRYPHELSGGQRQRINIARTLALNPKFLVCDECVSALVF
jgi:ABC-type oligopeptide transport system ATPase subunit